jgi:membrane-associated protein
MFHKLIHLVQNPGQLGYIGLALIVFLETGALCFFLPGDSLLVTAGVVAAGGGLHIVPLDALLIGAAIAGPVASYWIGASANHLLVGRLYKQKHVDAAHAFYEKRGALAIILARFVPLFRTFVPVVAGIARMPYSPYTLFNVIGGTAWILSMTLIGFSLGRVYPGAVKHIEIVIVAVVFLSVLPAIITWLRARKETAKENANG